MQYITQLFSIRERVLAYRAFASVNYKLSCILEAISRYESCLAMGDELVPMVRLIVKCFIS